MVDVLNVDHLSDVVDACDFNVRDTDGLLFESLDDQTIGDTMELALDHVSYLSLFGSVNI
jgi:hypothetical protein